jgi:hypothetical protein
MLTLPITMHVEEPPWRASARPPSDISRWRLDGRLSNLIAQRFDMDNDEALRFALACGGDLACSATGVMAGQRQPDGRSLRATKMA